MTNVRSMLGKVRLHRPDLKDSTIDFYAQETVRKICRQSMLLQTEQSFTASNGINFISLASENVDINRVHQVETLLDNKYVTMQEFNFIDVNGKFNERSQTGEPGAWAFDLITNKLMIYPVPNKTYTMKVRYSYVPKGEIINVSLPVDAEDAIIYGTLSEIYLLPGPGMSPQLSQNFNVKFNNEIANLKSIAILGNSGILQVKGTPLGGLRDRNTYNPYGW